MNIKPLQDWLIYYIKYKSLGSISFAIIMPDKIITDSLGEYNKETHLTATVESVYQIASLSKIYTAIEILKAQHNDLLHITDLISKHLNYFPNKNITIKDLLSHNSGLERDGDFNFWLSEKFPSETELIEYVKTLPNDFDKYYKYSNLGYAILGLVLSSKGIKFDRKKQNVVGYGKKKLTEVKEYNYIDFQSFVNSFGLYKNIVELSEFTQAVLNRDDQLLNTDEWDLLLKPEVITNGDEDDMAFGFKKWKESNIFEADGVGFGFVSSMLIDYDMQTAFVVLINSGEESYANYFTRSLRKYLLLCKENAIDQNSKLNGLYKSKDYDVFVIDAGDKLYLFNPANETPFHDGDIEEYVKVGENRYLITNSKDPYVNEYLKFDYNNESITGFRQGGWGFKKETLGF